MEAIRLRPAEIFIREYANLGKSICTPILRKETSMAQCRILLVDDDPLVRSFVEATLKAREYLVDQANDGADALEVLQTLGGTVDLLITDIRMPRMDGVALARAVAEMFPAMPVLFISGWADPLEEPEWQKPEYAFLRKPFLPKVLISSLEELRGRSARKAASALT
jgi:CheY-like chemotaxis protein